MRNLVQFVCVTLLAGCVYLSHYEKVLQRSEERVPTWVSETEGNKTVSQIPNSQTMDIVIKRKQVYNLSLGIKQVENMISVRLKSVVSTYELKTIYWEYRQKELPNGTENYYVIWVCISVPKSEYEKALQELS